MDIRGSEVQDFLRCRQRWDYRWKQNLIPKKKNSKLFFGELFHIYLEYLYKTRSHESAQSYMFSKFDQAFDSDLELEDMEDRLRIISNNYFEKYKVDFLNMEVIGVEVQFSVPLTKEINFTGTIDLIFRDEQDNLWFMDHKTTNSIEKYEKNALMDRQINRYWWAIQQVVKGNGYLKSPVYRNFLLDNPYGFIYNIIYKDYPVPPKLLNTGKLSKDKNQKTTYDLYMKEIIDRKLVKDDYADMLEHLSSQGDKFFSRLMVHRNQQEIDCTMNEIQNIVLDIEQPRMYRNITTDCHWDCQYKDLCMAEIDGSDAQWLKDELYKKGEKMDDISD